MKYPDYLLAAIMLLLISNGLNAAPTDDICNQGEDCITSNSWQFGVAMGLGGRSNPLVDGNTIPLVLIPDIAWYGESAYFDNGELGWQWLPNRHSSIELFVAPNIEKANFTFWHTANILIPAASLGNDIFEPGAPNIDPSEDTHYELSVDDVQSRRWAFDIGLRWQWIAAQHRWSMKVASDISGVHQGQHALLEYRYHWRMNRWRFSIAPHIKWVSSDLTDYYYGVSSEDTEQSALWYQGRSGTQWGLAANAAYIFNEHWQGMLRIQSIKLHTGMVDSPLVNESHIHSVFVGLAYRF